jgi:hypothetical protein
MTNPERPVEPGHTSLLDQFGKTRESLMGLAHAHVDLFKAELNDIIGEIKKLATFAGIALGIALMTGVMLWVGGFLFLGEWLFGSIGWGFAHGVLLGIALLVALALAIVGSRARYAATSFLVALAIVVIVALVCGTNIASNAAASVAGNLAAPINTPGWVAVGGGAVVGAIVFAILLAVAAGGRGFIGGLIVGLFIGGLVGWLIAGAPWTWPPAVGFAIVVGLIAWPILNVILAWSHLDPAERFARLYPRQSIEAAQETRQWLEEQWQTRRPGRGSK